MLLPEAFWQLNIH